MLLVVKCNLSADFLFVSIIFKFALRLLLLLVRELDPNEFEILATPPVKDDVEETVGAEETAVTVIEIFVILLVESPEPFDG